MYFDMNQTGWIKFISGNMRKEIIDAQQWGKDASLFDSSAQRDTSGQFSK